MKKCYSFCAGPAYYRMCSTDVSVEETNRQQCTKETITHHFFVSGIGQKKTVIQPKFVAAENVVKTEIANIRKWIIGLLLWHLYSAGSACVLLTIIA